MARSTRSLVSLLLAFASALVVVAALPLTASATDTITDLWKVQEENPIEGWPLPNVTVTVTKAEDCDPLVHVLPGRRTFIQAEVFVGDGPLTKKSKPVIIFKNKVVRRVNEFKFIPGVELGLIGACPGEQRVITMPAELGFPRGAKSFRIPPNTPLTVKVDVKFTIPSPANEARQDIMHPDTEILEVMEGKLPKTTFKKVQQVTNQEQFSALTKDKTAVVFLYAEWCGPCPLVAPAMDAIASKLGKAVGGGKAAKKVVVLAVDATEFERDRFTGSFPVSHFPAVVVQRPDGTRTSYTGRKTAEDIAQFITAPTKSGKGTLEVVEPVSRNNATMPSCEGVPPTP